MSNVPFRGLIVSAPNRLSYDGRTTTAGACVWLALESTIDASGRIPAVELSKVVYGESVRRERLHALVHRAAVKLAAVGAPWRLSIDGPDVVLV